MPRNDVTRIALYTSESLITMMINACGGLSNGSNVVTSFDQMMKVVLPQMMNGRNEPQKIGLVW